MCPADLSRYTNQTMSSTDDSPGRNGDVPTDARFAVELDRAYDDREEPSTLTVFPAGAEWPEIGTTWISMDVDHAVSVAECR